MAEKTGLSRKIGPLPVAGWAGVGVGVLFLVYELRRRSAKAAATGAAGLTSGGTTPAGQPVTTILPTTGSQYATLSQWQAAFQQAFQIPANWPGGAPTKVGDIGQEAQNAFVRWQNYQCVAPNQARAIGNILATVGNPPGATAPPITICRSKSGAQETIAQYQKQNGPNS